MRELAQGCEVSSIFHWSRLDLFAEEGYVEIIKSKLDPDSLGIILLPLFLEEFYPEDKPLPDSFTLYHYNGLNKADSKPVSFIKGWWFNSERK